MSKVMKFLAIFAVVFMMVSCNTTYYQVYDIQSENLSQYDNSLVYENEDCKVMYNFWSENGKVKFSVYNKTNKDIFIDMEKTFLIVNNQANDYYKGITYIKGYTDGFELSYSKSTKRKETITGTTATKEKEVECIPANSFKVIDKCSIDPKILLTCDKKRDFPSNAKDVQTYEQNTTPYSVTNHIAYSFDKDNIHYIDNMFWVSKITNYPQNKVMETVKNECYSTSTNNKNKQFIIGGPNKFYITYNKKDITN